MTQGRKMDGERTGKRPVYGENTQADQAAGGKPTISQCGRTRMPAWAADGQSGRTGRGRGRARYITIIPLPSAGLKSAMKILTHAHSAGMKVQQKSAQRMPSPVRPA